MKRHTGAVLRLLALATMVLATACNDSNRPRSFDSPVGPGECVPGPIQGELLVTFLSTTTEAEARAVIDAHGLAVLRVSLGFSAGLDHRWLLVGVPAGREAFWIAELAKSPLVTLVEQNSIFCAF